MIYCLNRLCLLSWILIDELPVLLVFGVGFRLMGSCMCSFFLFCFGNDSGIARGTVYRLWMYLNMYLDLQTYMLHLRAYVMYLAIEARTNEWILMEYFSIFRHRFRWNSIRWSISNFIWIIVSIRIGFYTHWIYYKLKKLRHDDVHKFLSRNELSLACRSGQASKGSRRVTL